MLRCSALHAPPHPRERHNLCCWLFDVQCWCSVKPQADSCASTVPAAGSGVMADPSGALVSVATCAVHDVCWSALRLLAHLLSLVFSLCNQFSLPPQTSSTFVCNPPLLRRLRKEGVSLPGPSRGARMHMFVLHALQPVARTSLPDQHMVTAAASHQRWR